MGLFDKKESIAIDIGTFSIKIVQLKKSGNSYTLAKWGVVPLSDINKDVSPVERKNVILSRLSDYLQREHILTKNVISSISGNQVIVRHVQFPKMPYEELAKNIFTHAEPFIPFDLNEVDLSFYIIDSSLEGPQAKMETVLVAAKKEFTQWKLDIFNTLNLRPVVIDIDAFAICNAYEMNLDKETLETVLIANIGTNTTNIAIIANRVSRVVRDVFVAGNSFTKAVMRALSCDLKVAEEAKLNNIVIATQEEKDKLTADGQKDAIAVSSALTQTAKELLIELQKSIDFYISQKPENTINRVLITGGGANLKNLASYLSQQLKIPVEIFNPLKKVNGAHLVPEQVIPELSVAVGLALRSENDIVAEKK
jgi:type IV pilus assembly protein PilM